MQLRRIDSVDTLLELSHKLEGHSLEHIPPTTPSSCLYKHKHRLKHIQLCPLLFHSPSLHYPYCILTLLFPSVPSSPPLLFPSVLYHPYLLPFVELGDLGSAASSSVGS